MIVRRKRPLFILLLAQAALVLTFVLTVPSSAGDLAKPESGDRGNTVDHVIVEGNLS